MVYYGRAVPRRLRGRYRRSGYYGRYKKRYVRGHVVVEKKFLDTDLTTAGFPSGSWNQLTNAWDVLSVPLGTGESSRNGRKIVITKISLRGTFYQDYDSSVSGTLGQDANECRLAIIIDRQANGSAPVPADVFDSLSTNGCLDFNNLSNKGRFLTIFDKRMVFNPQILTTAKNAANAKVVNFHKRCRIPILYDGPTGSVTERCCNNLLFFCTARVNDSTYNHIDFYGVCRIRFMDV
jgi:hypothetical protein